MHVLLYEWVTGGGLVDQSGRLPASMLAEGSAMIAALAADFAAIGHTKVSVLRDMRLHEPLMPGCEIVEVHSTAHLSEEFNRLASAADWSLVVAPEFDGILRTALSKVGSAGGRSLNAPDEFVLLASDKQKTADCLQQAGVPVPEACLIAADDPKLPAGFTYPAVLKPLDGAGSQHTLLVYGPGDEPPPYPWPRRLERYVEGRAASVAALCGTGRRYVLPSCWQCLSSDGRFTYRGGSNIESRPLAARAAALAERALAALPPAAGFVGVDLVLGNDSEGRDDAVLEVNPRVTTSYVGLRAAVKENLAKAMIEAVSGRDVAVTLSRKSVQFLADGDVKVMG